jgi:methyl-accepting chemotaxis protein
MISGYETLNENIQSQISIIDDVSNASREQKQAIEQINDAVNVLDKTTQQNAASANQISAQASCIKELSDKLVDVVNHTSYNQIGKQQVCDVDMLFTLNRLKLDHINFKDTNFQKLNTKTKWTVTNEKECNLGKWILEAESKGENFTKTPNWTKLKEYHLNVHAGVQSAIDANAISNIQGLLKEVSVLDGNVSNVFDAIQQIKVDNCKGKESLPNCEIEFTYKSEPAKTTSVIKSTPAKINSTVTQTKQKIETKSSYTTPNLREIKSDINNDDEWASF